MATTRTTLALLLALLFATPAHAQFYFSGSFGSSSGSGGSSDEDADEAAILRALASFYFGRADDGDGSSSSSGGLGFATPTEPEEEPDDDAAASDAASDELTSPTEPDESGALPDGPDAATASLEHIQLPDGEGSIEGLGGQYETSLQTGAGTYSIPLQLPPGPGGEAPELALSYASGAGNGPLGLGWSLPIPAIRRRVDEGLPSYLPYANPEAEDRFRFGGDALTPVDAARARADECAGLEGACPGVPADVAGWRAYRATYRPGWRFFRAPDGLRWVAQDASTGERWDFGVVTVGPEEMVDASVHALESNRAVRDEELPGAPGGLVASELGPGLLSYFQAGSDASSPYSASDDFVWNPTPDDPDDGPGEGPELCPSPDDSADLTEQLAVFAWRLTRHSDAQGNTTWYRWIGFGDGRLPRLASIHYGSPARCMGPGAEDRDCDAGLDEYFARVRFAYEHRGDVLVSFLRGWKTTIRSRLRAIRVDTLEDRDPSGAPVAPQRTFLRRWLLRYDGAAHHSLLRHVALEGRPTAPADAFGYARGQLLADTAVSAGELLFEIDLGYSGWDASELESARTLPRFGAFDVAPRSVVDAPDVSLGSPHALLVDANGDALPDVLVREPGAPDAELYFNGFRAGGNPADAASFSAPIALSETPTNLVPESALLRAGDSDTDGRVELTLVERRSDATHLEIFEPYRAASSGGVSPTSLGLGYRTRAEDVRFPGGVDITSGSGLLRLVDENHDGASDLVLFAEDGIYSWPNLARFGDGTQYGEPQPTADGWMLPNHPDYVEEDATFRRCAPHDGVEGAIRLADMNGDGLADLVKLRPREVAIYFGRGFGRYGEGAGGGWEVTQALPTEVLPARTHLVDMNADGVADLVELAADGATIWFGQGAAGGSLRASETREASFELGCVACRPGFASTPLELPLDLPDPDAVRFTDIDGNGTTDLLYAGAAGSWSYVAPIPAERPRLLTRVRSGLGAETRIRYRSATREYLRDLREADACGAAASCERYTWDGSPLDCGGLPGCAENLPSSPLTTMVVTRVETDSGLGDPVQVREIAYHDGVYSGVDRAFLGFRVTETVDVGDATQPSLVTRTHFHQGRRPAALAATPELPNPAAPLRGRPWLTETWTRMPDGTPGPALATEHVSYAIRRFDWSRDPREAVAFAYARQTDRFVYGEEAGPAGSARLPAIEEEDASAAASASEPSRESEDEVALVAQQRAHLRTVVRRTSNLARPLEERADGEVGRDVPIATTRRARFVGADPWRTVVSHEHLSGEGGERGRVARRFDASGNPTREARPFGDGTTAVLARTFDGRGNPTESCLHGDASALGMPDPGACLRRRTVRWDDTFAQMPVEETLAVGVGPALRTEAAWDRGLGQPLRVSDPAGAETRMAYDGFGRLTARFAPDLGDGCAHVPQSVIRYELAVLGDGAGVPPLHRVRTWLDTELEEDEAGSRVCPESLAELRETVAYADGLGRSRAVLTPAAEGWIRSGYVALNGRGETTRAYEAHRVASAAPEHALAPPSAVPWSLSAFEGDARNEAAYAETLYDASGRPTRQTDPVGAVSLLVHEPLATRSYDALDLDPASPFLGTYSVAREDGHGRSVEQIRVRRDALGGSPSAIRLRIRHDALGTPLELRRFETADALPLAPDAVPLDGHEVVRSHEVDAQGRIQVVHDPSLDGPDGAGWRYGYDVAGDLVEVRDPRGCGRDYFYDRAGRMTGERYVDCAEAAPSPAPGATLPAGAVGPGGVLASAAALHVRHHFDRLPSWVGEGFSGIASDHPGRLVATEDLAQRTLLRHDARGRQIRQAVQLAGATLGPLPADLDRAEPLPGDALFDPAGEAVEYDTTHTYLVRTAYTPDDRVARVAYPRDPDWARFGGGELAPRIAGGVQYDTARRLPRRLWLTIGDHLTRTLVDDIRYLPSGRMSGYTLGADVARVEQRFDLAGRPRSIRATREAAGVPTESDPLAGVAVLDDLEMVWDAVNLTQVVDHRDPSAWPEGHRPRRMAIQRDSLYRVTGVDFDYALPGGGFAPDVEPATDWRDEHALHRSADPMRATPAPRLSRAPERRLANLTYDYDFLGNTVEWTEPEHAFHERALGDITNGVSVGERPSALYLAADLQLGRGGWLQVRYDAMGNAHAVTVHGMCEPAPGGTCADPGGADRGARIVALESGCRCAVEQHYTYAHDAIGRLVEARRYDREGGEGPWQLAAQQRYVFDAAGQRRVKLARSVDAGVPSADRAELDVVPGDMVRSGVAWESASASWVGDPALGSETQYLIGGARLVWRPGSPELGAPDPTHRLTYALKDARGTSTAVLDLESEALLSYTTHHPNGQRETLLTRRDAMPLEREGFEGKVADLEVGLIYYGQRFLMPHLGRWVEPDPAEIHALGGGETGNYHHFLAANLLQAVDPLGLSPEDVAALQEFGPGGARRDEYVAATRGGGAIVVEMSESTSVYDVWKAVRSGSVPDMIIFIPRADGEHYLIDKFTIDPHSGTFMASRYHLPPATDTAEGYGAEYMAEFSGRDLHEYMMRRVLGDGVSIPAARREYLGHAKNYFLGVFTLFSTVVGGAQGTLVNPGRGGIQNTNARANQLGQSHGGAGGPTRVISQSSSFEKQTWGGITQLMRRGGAAVRKYVQFIESQSVGISPNAQSREPERVHHTTAGPR